MEGNETQFRLNFFQIEKKCIQVEDQKEDFRRNENEFEMEYESQYSILSLHVFFLSLISLSLSFNLSS